MAVICCSRNTLLVSAGLWLALSIGGLAFVLYGFQFAEGVYLVPPDTFYISLLGVFSLWIVVSSAGVVARLKHSEVFLTFFIIMGFLTVLITIFGSVFVILFLNDVSTFEGLDSSAAGAADNVEGDFFDWALSNPSDWIESQDELECCGYTYEGMFVANLTTGAQCDPTFINTLINFCPGANYSEACEDSARATFDGQLTDDFFCLDAAVIFFQEQTPFIGAGVGFIVLLQLASWVAALRHYWVPFSEGGFYNGGDDEGYGSELPTAKVVGGGPMPPPPPTSAFGQSVRKFGNRMSTRVEGIFGLPPSAAPPGPPPGQMTPFQGSGAPADAPAPAGPPPGFGGTGIRGAIGRVSMRIGGAFGMGGPRGPAGPPPGFGGGGSGVGQMGGPPMGGPPMGGPPMGGPPGGAPAMGGGPKKTGGLPAPNTFNAGGLPAPNTFNAGAGGSGGAPKPGFGAAMRGFGNRVSMKFAGKPMFGGGAPPRGPPPGFGGGGGAPQMGGGPPPMGLGRPPMGGGGPSSPPPPQQQRVAPAAPTRKTKGGKKGGKKGGGGGGGAPAMGGGRGGLLAQIQGGARLNKAVTNDKSGPAFEGRVLN